MRNQCEEYSLVESVLNKNVGIDSRPAVRSKRKEGSFHQGSYNEKKEAFTTEVLLQKL